jgi:hypothetical protein
MRGVPSEAMAAGPPGWERQVAPCRRRRTKPHTERRSGRMAPGTRPGSRSGGNASLQQPFPRQEASGGQPPERGPGGQERKPLGQPNRFCPRRDARAGRGGKTAAGKKGVKVHGGHEGDALDCRAPGQRPLDGQGRHQDQKAGTSTRAPSGPRRRLPQGARGHRRKPPRAFLVGAVYGVRSGCTYNRKPLFCPFLHCTAERRQGEENPAKQGISRIFGVVYGMAGFAFEDQGQHQPPVTS